MKHVSVWCYRVMRRQYRHYWGIEKWDDYGIYEVFDNNSWTEKPCGLSAETLAELKANYKAIGGAFKLPVLDYKTGKPIKKGET